MKNKKKLDMIQNLNTPESEDFFGQYQNVNKESQNKEEDKQEHEIKEEFSRGKRIKKTPSKLKDYVLTYENAITESNKEKQRKAIEEERKSLEENNT